MKNSTFSTKKKNRKKLIRSIIEGIILIVLLIIIIKALFTFSQYEEYTQEVITKEDNGFIALSYFGVDRAGNETLISEKRLQEHLKALNEQGYVTITQQDIYDYYKNGKQLPEKSLFLMFEDGRRDTAIFAQNIIERYNYKASAMFYVDKFEKADTKFLIPDDLVELVKSTFWELGCNGYRLEYINVFDRYHNYLGELTSLEFAELSKYLGRDYNHYLMDFIRDEYGIPKESYDKMIKRIAYDYEVMQSICIEELGGLPALYVLMHSNTNQFGSHNLVSDENEKWITKLFQMNFNREGFAKNTIKSSLYDLTRLQPQAYWYPNHLLMRIWDDTKQEMQFVTGDKKRAQLWKEIEGKAEFRDETIVLTSIPNGEGLLSLKENDTMKNIQLSVTLLGNKFGSQAIYMRADEEKKNALCVQLKNNNIYIKEFLNGRENVLYTIDLNEFDLTKYDSIPEDEKNAKIQALKTKIKYSENPIQKQLLKEELMNLETKQVKKAEEGAKEYKPDIELKESGNRQLQITLYEDSLSLTIDGKAAIEQLSLQLNSQGAIYLSSEWGGESYSQRNLTDDVYDGVFQQLLITENTGLSIEKETIFYDDRFHNWKAVKKKAKEIWEDVINWFITYL